MALRLRRGTNAERLLTTPVEGELIYTTDTKQLYAGDGSTAGGTLVSGSGGGGGVTSLDALTDTDLTGTDNGDALIFNASTNNWEATPLPGASAISLNDIQDVFIANPIAVGDILSFDGLNFTAGPATDIFQEQQNYRINIVGENSTILVDTDTNTITGNFVGEITATGTLDGDVNGSVFGDNSSIIIDGIDHTIYTERLTLNENKITYSGAFEEPVIISNNNRVPVRINSVTDGSLGGFPYTEFNAVKGSIENPSFLSAGDVVGGWKITGYTDFDNVDNAPITKITGMAIGNFDSTANLTDEFPKSELNLFVSAGGTSYQLFNLNSIGQFTAPGPIKPGVFADATARDAAIPSPEAGMIVFVTDVAKFQGNTDGTIGGWANLN